MLLSCVFSIKIPVLYLIYKIITINSLLIIMNRNQLNAISLKVAPVIIWGVLIMIPLLLPFGDASHDLPRIAVYNILLSNTVSLVLFYIHTFLLYPLIRNKKIGWYLLFLT